MTYPGAADNLSSAVRRRGDKALDHHSGMDQGMRALSSLISGVLVWGALGWLGDHLLGVSFLLPIGIVLGAALGCYVVIRRFWNTATAPTASGQVRPKEKGEQSTWAR